MATIVTRAGKGSPLTHTEMDANLDNMNDQKIELTSETGSCVFPNGTTAQRDGTPQAGYSRFNTDTDSVEVYDGTAWVGFGGASAINELNDATVSASDPTITTNPIATGQLWVNKTSGECYVCTDNTTDANIWTNIGGGSGNVSPNDPPVITGLTVTPSLPSSLSSDTTTLFTWSGATDPDGNDANIVYSATAISDSNLTIAAPSGGTQGQLNLTVAAIGSDVSNVSFKIRVTDEYGNVVDSSTYTLNLLANQAPVITGLTVDTTALASYTWSDVNTGSTNTYTIAGATDPDGTDGNIDYSIVNISNANLTASGGVNGADVTLTVATIGSDISGVTFNIRATDEDGGTADSAQQSIDLVAFVATVATGGTITTDGDYKVHTFTASGSFVVTSAGTGGVDYLNIAGGGGGGKAHAGAGGAGGYRTATGFSVSAQSYSITIGGGAAGSTNDQSVTANGSNSIFSTITSSGGGGGGTRCDCSDSSITMGNDGGSGGGGAGSDNASGAAGSASPSGQGNDGGDGIAGGVDASGGGGGGAGAAGANASSGVSGNGGAGLSSSITGSSVTRGGGGGGGAYAGKTRGTGGSGGGGNGASSTAGSAGSANTGGGGGGGSSSLGAQVNGYNGGSGVVIIRYKYQ